MNLLAWRTWINKQMSTVANIITRYDTLHWLQIFDLLTKGHVFLEEEEEDFLTLSLPH